MDKPLSLIMSDAKKNIVDCINSQHIQPCLMQYIIKDIYDMVVEASEAAYDRDMLEYSMREENEKCLTKDVIQE